MSETVTTVDLEKLLGRFAAGDVSARDALLAQAMNRLQAVARRLLQRFGGEARVEMWSVEVVHEAYPRIVRALDDVKPTSGLQFMGLARLQMQRALLDHIRALEGRNGQRSRPLPLAGTGTDAPACDPASESITDEHRMLLIDLLEAISKLPYDEANTVWAKLAGYTHKEIGEQLGVHMDTIDRYWNKACVKLRRELAPFIDGI